MKPRIFIGSSSEALEVAKEVKAFFENDYEAYLWTDDIFKFNENFLETLMKEANLFDFGLLIFTKDDYTKSRLNGFDTPRDNVIFEYGLFLGRLGRNNAFVIKDENVKLPSDLLGITLATFKCKKKKKLFNKKSSLVLDKVSLLDTLAKLKRQMDEKLHLGVLGMLPSTVLAIGYFNNFIKPICEFLSSGVPIVINEVSYTQFIFKIILPKDLDSDIKRRAIAFYKQNNYESINIPTSIRPYPLFVAVDTSGSKLVLSDMPATLSGIDKAIEMHLRIGHIGKSTEQQLLEDRELRNFGTVLEHLVNADAFCKSFVVIEIETS
ncbi:MAG: hypothetical protein H6Q14_2320 [Bacteroidetes bacterium]|nr:hypothetical protein [Bacteroidota bacterium]